MLIRMRKKEAFRKMRVEALHISQPLCRAPASLDRCQRRVSNFDQFFVGLPITLQQAAHIVFIPVTPRLAEDVVA